MLGSKLVSCSLCLVTPYLDLKSLAGIPSSFLAGVLLGWWRLAYPSFAQKDFEFGDSKTHSYSVTLMALFEAVKLNGKAGKPLSVVFSLMVLPSFSGDVVSDCSFLAIYHVEAHLFSNIEV